MGLEWVLWAVCVRGVLLVTVAGFINSVGHAGGPPTFQTPDFSQNVWWLSLFALGEGWHNNHHASERSAAHGRRWQEIDPTYWAICLFERVGLAWDVIHPGSPADAAVLQRLQSEG